MAPHAPTTPHEGVRATIATVRDRWDRQVASIDATPGLGELDILVHLEPHACRLPCKEKLASLADQKVTMLLSGVLRVTCGNGTGNPIFLDEFIARVSDCQLRLVYDRDGISRAVRMLEDIWS